MGWSEDVYKVLDNHQVGTIATKVGNSTTAILYRISEPIQKFLIHPNFSRARVAIMHHHFPDRAYLLFIMNDFMTEFNFQDPEEDLSALPQVDNELPKSDYSKPMPEGAVLTEHSLNGKEIELGNEIDLT